MCVCVCACGPSFRSPSRCSLSRVRYRLEYTFLVDVRINKHQETVLRAREERLLFRLALLLGSTRGPDQFEAWNANMDLVTAVTRAFSERLMFQQFMRRVNACADEAVKPCMRRLASLFALTCMERDLRWFITSGALSTRDVPVIMSEIDALTRDIVPEATTLIKGFGIPDHMLSAPIAHPDYMQRFQ